MSTNTKAEEKTKPHVNNLMIRAFDYCCGAVELGNFNYVDSKPFHATHFHKAKAGGWQKNPNTKDDPTTLQDIRDKLTQTHSSLVIATLGGGQEYVAPMLSELGFQKTFTFVNPDHANTPVEVWCKAKKPFVEKEPH